MSARARSALVLLCGLASAVCVFLWATRPLRFSGVAQPRTLLRKWSEHSQAPAPTPSDAAASPAADAAEKSRGAAGVVPLGAVDNLFYRSNVFWLESPAVRFEPAHITFMVDNATYSQVRLCVCARDKHKSSETKTRGVCGACAATLEQALAAHEAIADLRLRQRQKDSPKAFQYRLGKETAASTITHMQQSAPRKCDVSIDKPVLIAPLIGVTFGENFYRTVMQAFVAVRAIEKEFGISSDQLEVVFHDPQREDVVSGLRSISELSSSGGFCHDDVRVDYANESYTVTLQHKPNVTYTYSTADMKRQCDELLPQMPFQQHVGPASQQFNNEVFAYLQLLDLGTLKSAHLYHGQTVCPTKAFLLRADYLRQWQLG